MLINSTSAIVPTGPTVPSKPASATPSADFGQMFSNALKDVNQSQTDAKTMQENLLSNKSPVDYQDVMIAMEKASTAMQLTMSIRNKVLESYQEISRMQV